jgi:nitrite reductase/ring-hydroxylating ferredoxin subunit
VTRHFACRESDLAPGGRVLRDLDGTSVGVFNVGGRYFALQNRCPHRGGALCAGPVTGTTLPTNDLRYVYAREGEIVRCAWHGWEFEISTGRSLIDPSIRAKTFAVEVEAGSVYVLI